MMHEIGRASPSLAADRRRLGWVATVLGTALMIAGGAITVLFGL
jgi:hypothetical protein